MPQLKIYHNIKEEREKLKKNSVKVERQLTIIEAFNNIYRRQRIEIKNRRRKAYASRQSAYKSFLKRPKIIRLGMMKERFRNNIAYLSHRAEESLDLYAFDALTGKRVGHCEFSNLYLTNIIVSDHYQSQGIGMTFLRLANKCLIAPPRYNVNNAYSLSRYTPSDEGAGLINKALKKGVIKKSQLDTEPIHSPGGLFR